MSARGRGNWPDPRPCSRGPAPEDEAHGLAGSIGLAIVLAVAFTYSLPTRDDSSDSTETGDTTTTAAADATTTTVAYSNPELAAEVLAREPPVPANAAADTPPDAVEVTTLIQGQGEGAAAGDTVTVHYVGVLSDGTEFDQSWSRGQPFPVENLGQASVIPGWNEGLVGPRSANDGGSRSGPTRPTAPPAIPRRSPPTPRWRSRSTVDITKPNG